MTTTSRDSSTALLPRAEYDRDGAAALALPARSGLSAKLLVLTILFVMLGEVLIYVPSIANFRLTWLGDRLAAARIAALVLDAGPAGMVPRSLEKQLLKNVGVKMIAMKRGHTRRLLAIVDPPTVVHRAYDLRERRKWAVSVFDALESLFGPPGRVIRVVDSAPGAGDFIEIVLPEAPLKSAMLRYSWNILLLSLIISMLTAGMVYVALNRLLVRPMQRLTESMLRFRQNPEDSSRIVKPSDRKDEIGVAERQLAGMQRDLGEMLRQRGRLAALGLAVAKINHDLRNLLASVQVLSDGIETSEDPLVQRFGPKMMRALDRAIAFCQSTLVYGQAQEPPPRRSRVALRALVEEVAETVGLSPPGPIGWANDVPEDLVVNADSDQLFRVLLNLARNAMQVIEGQAQPSRGEDHVRIGARREGETVAIEVSDTGPGVPEALRGELFEPFRGSTYGGSGLGLAIAEELIRAHGGTIRLAESATGATFRVTLSDPPGARGGRRG